MFDFKRQEGQNPLPTCAPKSKIHIANINASSNKSIKILKQKWDHLSKSNVTSNPCCQKDNGES